MPEQIPETTIDPPAEIQRATRSPKIDKLAGALCAAQAELEDARKTSKANAGAFVYEYADLTEVWRVARPVLSSNGLAVAQTFDRGPTGTCLLTLLTHSSGQFIESRLPLMQVSDYHALGSAVTYSRRYSLAAILGISSEADDDGGAAMVDKAPIPKRSKSIPRRGPRVKKEADAKPAQAKANEVDRDDGRPRGNRTATTPTTTPPPNELDLPDDMDDEATKIAKSVPGCVDYLRAMEAWNEGSGTVKDYARQNVVKQGVEGMEKVVAQHGGED